MDNFLKPKMVTLEKVFQNRVNELEGKLKLSFENKTEFSLLDACLLSHYRLKLFEEKNKNGNRKRFN